MYVSLVMQKIPSRTILALTLTLTLDPRKWFLERAKRKAEKQSKYPGEDPKHLRIDSISENGYEGREKNRRINLNYKYIDK